MTYLVCCTFKFQRLVSYVFRSF